MEKICLVIGLVFFLLGVGGLILRSFIEKKLNDLVEGEE